MRVRNDDVRFAQSRHYLMPRTDKWPIVTQLPQLADKLGSRAWHESGQRQYLNQIRRGKLYGPSISASESQP